MKTETILRKPTHLLEQRDRFNQRLTLDLELDNGEKANFNSYVKGLVATQSLEAWNGNQDQFRDWIAKCVADYAQRLQVKIYGHSN